MKREKFIVLILFITNCLFLSNSYSQISEFDSNRAKAEDALTRSPYQMSDVEFLIGLTQVIVNDKDRLRKLMDDSIAIEPLFEEMSVRFYNVNLIFDSLRSNAASPDQIASVDFERRHLKEILHFFLERRRSKHFQIRLLNLKVKKEEEVLKYFVKGETFTVLEKALKRDLNVALPNASVDSISSQIDSLQEVRFDLNDFNWAVIKAERELALLQARFEFVKNKSIFVEDLLSLNEDEMSLVKALARSEELQQVNFKRHLQSLNQIHEEVDSSLIRKMRDQTAMTLQLIASRIPGDSVLVSDLESRIVRLKSIQKPISEEGIRTTRSIERKSRWLHFLKSPLAPHRITSFLLVNGPRLLVVVIGLVLLWFFSRWMIGVGLAQLKFRQYKSTEEREERIETLRRAFRSALTIIFLVVAVLTLLSEFGVNLSVLLGGAAVFSLALAFGAQSLVKDYFSGFMILSENQYRVGNVVQINNVSGVVEDITLRMTILRDLEGVAHFVPHGEIKLVSNLSHGWSRVVLDLKVAYKENVDTVMDVTMDVAKGLRVDHVFGRFIIDEPEMLGVDAFVESGVIVKVLVKTLPLKQWLVKREFLRRIKNRFDELKIEIAIPHSKVYYESDGSVAQFDSGEIGKDS